MTWTKFSWPAFPFFLFDVEGTTVELKKPVDIIPDRFNVVRISDMVTTQIHGLGAPVAASPSRTATKGSPAPSERVGGRPSSAHGFRSGKAPTARGKCPKGHYWSYKEKKCLKSKFQ